MRRAGLGFRVKTGYATAIVLSGPAADPEFLARETVLLADLDNDDSRQPYHAALERGERVGAVVVRKARKDATLRATAALEELVQLAIRHGAKTRSIGLVVGSEIDPLRLGNLHVRAHAFEGQFYRQVLEHAATEAGLQRVVLLERETFATAQRLLRRDADRLKAVLASMGKPAGRPWRREEHLATLAAWIALAS